MPYFVNSNLHFLQRYKLILVECKSSGLVHNFRLVVILGRYYIT